MVRDQALLVSGLLSPKQFGPPVYPPQPDGVWKSVYSGAKWTTSEGDDRYRRALYTYSKRTSGYPPFLTFDAPTRDVCSARRIPTNTPLQALVTLNDPAHIEFAQAFAKRMADAGPDLATRLAHGYRLLTLRQPPTQVIDTLSRLHADTLARIRRLPEEAAKLAADPRPGRPRPRRQHPAQLRRRAEPIEHRISDCADISALSERLSPIGRAFRSRHVDSAEPRPATGAAPQSGDVSPHSDAVLSAAIAMNPQTELSLNHLAHSTRRHFLAPLLAGPRRPLAGDERQPRLGLPPARRARIPPTRWRPTSRTSRRGPSA